MKQSQPPRLVAAKYLRRSSETRLVTLLRNTSAAATLILASTASPALANEVDAVRPLLADTVAAIEATIESKVDASPTPVGQKLLTQPTSVDFNIGKIDSLKLEQKTPKSNSTPTINQKTPQVQSAVRGESSFSAAFTEALESIAEFNASKQPTPANDASIPSKATPSKAVPSRVPPAAVPSKESVVNSTKSALTKLKDSVEANVIDASRQETAQASKTTTPSTSPAEKITVEKQKKAQISPSVASRKDGVPTVSSDATPLNADLQKYFDTLDVKPVPESAETQNVLPPQSTSAPELATKSEPQAVEMQPEPKSNFPDINAPKFQMREPGVVISRQMSALQPKIAKTLRFYWDKPLNTKDDSAWSVMHSFLGYGPNGMVAINSDRGQRANAVNWMCRNQPLMGRRLLYLENGYIKGVEGAGYQGHPCQFLAMLAQIDIPRSYPLSIQGQQLTVEDLINSEMYTCSTRKELTFKLIAFSHYLNSDATWKSESGETWTIPQILGMEMGQPVNGSACGGTHRIMSISFAIRNRQMRGEPLDGVYVQAQNYVRQYQRYALSLQNRDGSFSTDWFKNPADSKDKDRQLQTTGHILEWLVYSLPRNELSDPRIVKAAEFLNNLMTRHRYRDWEVGPRGHAIRALSLYHKRVFERQPTSPRLAAHATR